MHLFSAPDIIQDTDGRLDRHNDKIDGFALAAWSDWSDWTDWTGQSGLNRNSWVSTDLNGLCNGDSTQPPSGQLKEQPSAKAHQKQATLGSIPSTCATKMRIEVMKLPLASCWLHFLPSSPIPRIKHKMEHIMSQFLSPQHKLNSIFCLCIGLSTEWVGILEHFAGAAGQRWSKIDKFDKAACGDRFWQDHLKNCKPTLSYDINRPMLTSWQISETWLNDSHFNGFCLYSIHTYCFPSRSTEASVSLVQLKLWWKAWKPSWSHPIVLAEAHSSQHPRWVQCLGEALATHKASHRSTILDWFHWFQQFHGSWPLLPTDRWNRLLKYRLIEGSLEVKLPTIWRDEKQSRAEAERRGRLEERRSEEKE